VANLILIAIVALIGVIAASDIIVNAAQKIARNLKISELVIGLTVTAIGTNLPEIFTTIAASLNNLKGIESSGIALGNIVGSCTANITIILGLCGIFSIFVFRRKSLYRDCLAMFLSAFLVIILSLDRRISQIEGIVLIMIYAGYLLFMLEREKVTKTEIEYPKSNMFINLILIAAAITALILFAEILVNNAVKIAALFAVPESLIGVLIGLGTSMPELAVSFVAIIRKSGMLSIGNLLGSNIANTLLVLGLGGVISGFNVGASIIQFDMIFWIASTVIVTLLLFNHLNLNSKESSVLFVLYVLYIYLKITYSL
jgi:cation:H+ antiporter